MDSRNIYNVQDSFSQIEDATKPKIIRVLLDRMFELDESLKKLFKKDTRDQRKKTLKALIFTIENLRDADTVGPYLKNTAIKLAEHGFKKSDYKTFGTALIFSISAGLGDDFTPRIKNAWIIVYDVISEIMIAEAYIK